MNTRAFRHAVGLLLGAGAGLVGATAAATSSSDPDACLPPDFPVEDCSLVHNCPAVQDCPSIQDCEDAWQKSSAANTCFPDITVDVSEGKCQLSVTCEHPDVFAVLFIHNDFSGSTSEVESLHACEGTLQTSEC